MAIGRSRIGKLVETAPDTFEVVWESSTKKPARPKRVASSPPKKETDGWFLSQDRTQVVDASGKIISTEVFVLKVSNHNYYEQIYIRFLFDHVIWTGYTKRDPPLKLIAHPSKLPSLDCQTVQRAMHQLCPECQKTLLRRGLERCAACAEKKREKQICGTRGCGKVLHRTNKSGFCVECLRQNGFGEKRRVFNPYYGCLVEKGKIDGEK